TTARGVLNDDAARSKSPAASANWMSVVLEELHRPLVLFSRLACLKCAQVAAMSRSRVDLAGIKPVFARMQFTDHGISSCGYHQGGDAIGVPATKCCNRAAYGSSSQRPSC